MVWFFSFVSSFFLFLFFLIPSMLMIETSLTKEITKRKVQKFT